MRYLTYVNNVNRGYNLWRPDGAVDGALITVEHDMEMLDHIRATHHDH